ncbi:hypothetical protein [Paracoccus tibetensis]|uniref:Uncharacterized protein n=1 Tax=Paracoccus tibetensis TaxID=336292 RepID=A0A1G5JH52_9RHOB|nr:hypothetical protein [Paracoccus tibetensis]SCY87713.1 hypothetical protein SAMN05660710_03208 [Paracoccus tibetensis]
MPHSRRHRILASSALALALALIAGLILMTQGGALGSADRRLVDRHHATMERCMADGISITERSIACVEMSRIRDDIRARGLCFDLTGARQSYQDVYRCQE